MTLSDEAERKRLIHFIRCEKSTPLSEKTYSLESHYINTIQLYHINMNTVFLIEELISNYFIDAGHVWI